MIAAGEIIGARFRVLRMLGEGAMGAVYEAEHTLLGRRVAIKVLHERFGLSREALSRFHREARAAASIGHPQIVDVIDFGNEGVRPFLVMELLRGENLAQRLARSPLPDAAESCRIVGEVLSGLAAAHAHGIVHRDIKPENVFITREGRVKIVDFGVSKFRESERPGADRTGADVMLGTPGYIAPEQWGGAADVDARADLFSVGVILYELLTGGLPYEGATRAALYHELVKSDEPPPAPSSIAPEAPPALDELALRAVERVPARRFQSAEEFIAALVPHGAAALVERPSAHDDDDDEPVVPRAPLPTERDSQAVTSRPSRRISFTVTAIVVALTLVLSVALAASRGERRALRARAAPAATRLPPRPPGPAAIVRPETARAVSPPPPTAPVAPRTSAPHRAARRHVRHRITHRW